MPLRQEVLDATEANLQLRSIFERLVDLAIEARAGSTETRAEEGPAKKRKLDGPDSTSAGPSQPDAADELLYRLEDVSFTSPLRKKCSMHIHRQSIRLYSATNSGHDSVLFLTSDICYALCVPSPARAKPHFTFCLMVSGKDPIVFGFDVAKGVTINGPHGGSPADLGGADCKANIWKTLETLPCPTSELAGTNGELPALECAQNTTRGHMFFLPTGLLFGFKKPIRFLPFRTVTDIELIAVSRHFFTLAVYPSDVKAEAFTTRKPPTDGKLEFEMFPRQQMNRVHAYVESHRRNFARLRDVKGEVIENVTVPMDDDDEADEDFDPGDERKEVAEEFDSDHETDSQPSEQEQDGGDESESSEDDESDRSGGHNDASDKDSMLEPKQERLYPLATDELDVKEDEMGIVSVKSEFSAGTKARTGMAEIAAQVERERLQRQQPMQRAIRK
ncbi:uncharacterized protein EV422DRAFT_504161 [Fimicolochytrium jonesii]|uniref:uncharacterized protein n=1 Tax=Fimicolochytrium jonesii TaxID=1396493 RepID=UPI0022FE34E0|nr:uncharacterized protein EV422DRAFT_504161 [Fimicolochytrium jonesii]KAI8824100.1 hypothetical protein EV422DRAFT_504161 [Fimicolochytrium jonesii]